MTIKQNLLTKIHINHKLTKCCKCCGRNYKDVDIVNSCWYVLYNVYELTLLNWYITYDKKGLRKKKILPKVSYCKN